uniref:Reverse transcriptase domain-containing protein n=2 Tax=Podarcis muralis TaxID=64176 RepID=A0A670JC67_PODMU
MSLQLFSWNINGGNSPEKRRKIFHILKKEQLDIICLQETHVTRLHRKVLVNKRLGQEFISSDKVKKRGVVIYAKESLAPKFVFKDEQGRILAIEIQTQGEKFLIVGIYAPNDGKSEFFKKLHEIMLDFIDYNNIIMMGDMNGVVSTHMDKSQSQNLTSDGRLPKTFFELTENLDLIDIWRTKNPLGKEGTFFSEVHLSWTRIDQIWTSRGLAPKTRKVEICPRTCSDHNALKVELRLTQPGSFRWRMNDALLRDQEIVKKAQKTLKDYFEINLNTTVEKRTIWDASKAVMRGFLIQQNTIKKKLWNGKKDKILEKIHQGEKKLRTKPKSKEVLREIKFHQAQYSKLINQEIEWKIKQMKQRSFESANKCGKLLAWQLKKRQKLNTVTNLEIEGKMVQKPEEIRKCFHRYFKELYAQGPQKESEIDQFLKTNGLPKITQDKRSILNSTITSQEIEGAIQNMQLGKSPGPDGLTSKYYKTLKDYLIQPLLEVCNQIMEGKKTPESWKEAFITLIPKVETEKNQLKNYRPISLLNVDYKIFADILASRLKKVLNEVIHKDQAGFLPGRHLYENTRNIIDILELLQTNRNTRAVLIFIDAEKAFDNISWLFMKKNLEGMGVGRGFENGIQAIYSEQKAKLIVNNVVSEEFKIEKGTRQGCPLSPLLFISVLEVLLNMIREDRRVQGIEVGVKQYKLKAFADDLVLTLQEPEPSTKRALELISEFGRVAGFKLNKQKTKVLTKNLTPTETEGFQRETELNVVKKVKYLGINLSSKNLNLFKDNYEKCWLEVKKDLEIWSRLKLSLLGRIAAIKMNVLPKMLFLFQTLQIVDRVECFGKWQKDISRFVWQGKKPRIKFKILTDSKERGGFALPDLRLYYEAAAFCWLKDWFLLENTDVLDLEGFDNAFGWHAYLWYDKAKAHKLFKNHIVRKAIFAVWMKYKDLLECKTPRWLSPVEAKARKRLNMEAYWPKYWELIESIGDNWKLQSQDKLKNKVRDWLHYAQIQEVFKMDKKVGFQVEKSKLETELLEPKTKTLSRMYNLLLKWNTQDEVVKSAMIKWAQDVGHNIMFEDWERLWNTGMKFTACIALKENIMKMVYRWYMTPVKLAKIYHLSDNKCWKCKEAEGTFFHLWWTCPKVKAFWEMIHNELKKVFRYTFSKKPEAFLLGMVDQKMSKKDRTLFMYATTAARILIAKNWKTQDLPTLEDWQSQLMDYMELAELTGRIRDLDEEIIEGDWRKFKDYLQKHHKLYES